MAFKIANPDRLFDRSWRPCHPLRPRLSVLRRWSILVLFCILSTLIAGYAWLTDSRRVQAMASSYLSELLGGQVHIGRANLSIFEGLRLDDVTLKVDNGDEPDATIFHAQTCLIRYHPKELLAGQLAATQIIAIDPLVTLVQNPNTGTWNYQRMFHGALGRPHHDESAHPLVLPQIVLRDAAVSHMELRDGKLRPVGWYGLDGSLTPADGDPNQYDFELQSRGRASLGPSIDGSIRTDGGESFARARNFTFGADIKAMLPDEPRKWCEAHDLQGHIDVPEMTFRPPAHPGDKAAFRVEMALTGGEMAVQPEEWMSRDQTQNIQWFHDVLDTFEQRKWMSRQWAQTLRRLSTPKPLHCHEVSGTLVFTDSGIGLKQVVGRLETNWLNIDGVIDGYSPDAPASITLSSLPGHDLEIGAWSPTTIGSLPQSVQETFEHLHPQGTLSAWVKVERREPGGTPHVSGRIDLRDGQFRFSDFPFPIYGCTGTVLIGPDPLAGMEGIRVLNVIGHGDPDGINSNASIQVDGFVGPLSGVAAGAWLDVKGTNIHSEPAVLKALPPPVQAALQIFNVNGREADLQFRGDFTTHITRDVGPHKPVQAWSDVTIDDAEAALAPFPYPLRHITGKLEIRDGYLNVVDVRVKHGAATLTTNGVITWRTRATATSKQPFGPDLHIVGHDLPIDEDLSDALPDLPRRWLAKLGAGGLVDVDGRVFSGRSADNKHDTVDYAFDLGLHHGTLRPLNGQFDLAAVSGNLHVTPQGVELKDLMGHRGEGIVRAKAAVRLGNAEPKVTAWLGAENLTLDPQLYGILPDSVRRGWDIVHPEGSIDASLNYNSAAPQDSPEHLQMHLEPHDLAITPALVPYRLEKLRGSIDVTPTRVVMQDISAMHGDSTITISGQGDLTDRPEWDFKLAADALPVDADFLAAAPQSVASLLKDLDVHGKVGLQFSRLAYRPAAHEDLATRPSGDDLDFAAKISLKDASLQAGLAAAHVDASIDLAGLIRQGRLHRLAGKCDASSLTLAGRPAGNFKFDLAKETDDPILQIAHLQGSLGGGDVAGDGQFDFPDVGPSQYSVNLIMRDIDLQKITLSNDKSLHGRLTASLQMSGDWNDPSSRRGHGDVGVVGQDMYKVPVMLGLLQITNLALPVSSPFSQASTRYTIDGQKVEVERLDLKSNDMTMSGSGELDFGAGKVSLWLETDNPALVALPVVGPLMHGLRQELLKIHVSGTIAKPTVSTRSFDTITTTVDQVFNKNSDNK